MIQNLWGQISIWCGNHGDNTDIPLEPHAGNEGMSMFYSCPKYYDTNREKGELACANRINLIEYEEMVQHISDVVKELEEDGGYVDLTGMSWTNKKETEFLIFMHTANNIKVLVKNNRAIR